AGKPMLLYLKRPAPDQEPRLTALIDSIRAAGAMSYRTFSTPRELERLLVDDLAVVLSESFRSAAEGATAPRRSPTGPAEPGVAEVQMGLHTDEAALSHGQYASRPLNRCARLMAAAHGGQILMSDATEALVRSQLPDGATVLDLGEHRLRDPAGRMHIFQLVHPDLPGAFPALRTLDALPGNL